jgi:plastocyanin
MELPMRIPRILFGVPLLAAGALIPALGSSPHEPPAGAIGIIHEGFSKKVVTIHVGQTLTFENNSRFIHIIGAGNHGDFSTNKLVPMKDRVMLETDGVYTTGRWTTPGTFLVTCSVHPEMTIKVIVTR